MEPTRLFARAIMSPRRAAHFERYARTTSRATDHNTEAQMPLFRVTTRCRRLRDVCHVICLCDHSHFHLTHLHSHILVDNVHAW
jgi:hypothetical protein